MTDLFTQSDARVTQSDACVSCPPYGYRRTDALAPTSAPVTHSGAVGIRKPGSGSPRKRRIPIKETLLGERNRLLHELQEANGETDRTWLAYRPLKAEFDHCDSLMREWAEARHHGKLFRRDVWMSGLERRRNAGHASHPFKVKWQQADGWRKRVVEELRNINEALEK